MASNGPRDDFHNQPTQHRDFGVSEQPPTGEIPTPGRLSHPPEGFEQPGDVDPFDQETAPTPWYRKRAALITWLVSVVILIALIVFGVIELIHGQQTVTHVPKTTAPTSTTTTTTTPSTTTTTPSSASSSAEQPPPQQPTGGQTQQQPTGGQTQQPSHHHHLPQLPSVITVPGMPNPVTVPPGLR